jgi:succinate dehydrogenase / fumarate reductase cytochrome b subunit
MNLPDVLFLTALSVLVVALIAFSTLVVVAGARRGGRALRIRGVSETLAALELRPSDPAYVTRWAFYLHRLTGVGVLGFLALHIVDVSLLAFSARLYDKVHSVYGTPALRVLECGLVFAVLFHALNGLRILAVDGLGLSTRASRRALVPVTLVSVLAGLVASGFILAPVL